MSITMKKQIFFILILFTIFSCSRSPLKVDVSDISIDFAIHHFERDLVSETIDSDRVRFLEEKYGEFFKIFTLRMIWIGASKEDGFVSGLQRFANDTMIVSLNRLVSKKISSDDIENELEKAFKHYKYYFPEKGIPQVISCISGFNQSIVTSDNLIGISLDKFLGSDCSYYPQLGLSQYKCRRMNPVNIVPETMMAWALTEFPKDDNASNLLSYIIYQGKLMYFIDAMLPDLPDTLKIGFTRNQIDFCKEREAKMWAFLAEYKLLYSSQRMDVKRYIDDAPFTNSFTNESPGRTGVWQGWQIVRAYMRKNPEVSLSQLMQNQHYQEILNKSGYSPY